MIQLQPVVLEGEGIRLEPLRDDHRDALIAAATDGRLWELWYVSVPTPDEAATYVADALTGQRDGHMLPWVVRDRETGAIIGSTRYHDVVASIDRVEIGYTWYSQSRQRTHVNTTCKRLLLAHAFDTLQCIAVEFRTHRFNTQSRRAIERLGAQLDGILRSHQRGADGSLRDTAVYSIIASEWPAVRSHLDWQLQKPR
jgi:RimJ/RimL family protein N-acetyltransferase